MGKGVRNKKYRQEVSSKLVEDLEWIEVLKDIENPCLVTQDLVSLKTGEVLFSLSYSEIPEIERLKNVDSFAASSAKYRWLFSFFQSCLN